jgi:hypothetical protein
MKRRAEAIAKLDRYHPHSVKQHPLLSQEQKQRLMRSTLPCSKAGGTDNGAAGLRRPRYYAHSAIYFAAFANQIYTNGPDKVAGNTQHAAEVLARN